MKFLSILYFSFILSISLNAQNATGTDSLAKYSYLLLAMKNNISIPISIATAFLVKFQGKLFIVSAWHVLTGRDVYHNIDPYMQYDYLLLRYTDTSKVIRYAKINRVIGAISNSKIRPEFQTSPDMLPWGINLNIFEEPPLLNSIENILFLKPQIKIRKNDYVDTIVLGYGFSNFSHVVSPFIPGFWNRIDTISPSPYIGKIMDSSPIKDFQDSLYYPNKWYFMSDPIGRRGDSGCPIFLKCILYNKRSKKIKEWVEFGGSQSGANSKYNFAYIVKKIYLVNMINPLPRRK